MGTVLSNFATWVSGTLKVIVVYLYNYLIDLINAFISGSVSFVTSAASLLPDYTIPTLGQIVCDNSFLGALNWCLPISFFVDCITMMVVAYGTHLVAAPALRWLKILR